MGVFRYALLGGLDVANATGPVPLGTRKQRAVLAQLVLAGGQVVGMGRLIEGIWGEQPPDRAEATVQSHISGFRRALSPIAPARSGTTAGHSRHRLRAGGRARTDVDVWRFTDAVERARQFHSAGDLAAAADVLRSALAGYAPLLPEFDGMPFHDEAARHLERIHRSALELSYEIRLDLGEERMLAADLKVAVQRDPLHEGLWYLLAIARYRMGRQSEGLAALAECRRVLADEIGVDPSPRLRQLERDILSREAHLDPRPAPVVERATEATPEPAAEAPAHLIGRLDELAVLHGAMVSASAGGNSVLIVEGPSGVGKTALLDEATRRAREHGRVTTLWGRCVEGEGAPSMWPWVQILSQVLPDLPEAERNHLLDTELGRMVTFGVTVLPPPTVPDPDARFRLFGQAADLLGEVAARFPLLIVVDDIQWADAASLELLVHIASRRPRAAVFVGALRTDTALRRTSLEQALATLSRLSTHRRVSLGPLARAEVGELIRQETGSWPTADLVGAIETRTEGNPFFVRELSRLLRDTGHLADGTAADVSAGVPSGVRDVVRGRLAGLDTATTRLLQLAALIGKQVDLELLATAAELDIDAVLDALEPAESLAVLEQVPDDPFAMRFTHDLMREAIAETVTPLRVRRMHLQIADALDSPQPSPANKAERLAHHLWSAGPLAPRQRTASALIASSRVELGTFAYESAQRQLEVGARPRPGRGRRRPRAADAAARDLGDQRAPRLHRCPGRTARARRGARHFTRIHPGGSGVRVRAVVGGVTGAAARRGRRANLRHDLLLLCPAFLAFMTTLHVSVEAGRALFDRMEAEMGDDRHARIVLSAFAGSAATMLGEREWTLHASAIGIAADPDRSFVFPRRAFASAPRVGTRPAR